MAVTLPLTPPDSGSTYLSSHPPVPPASVEVIDFAPEQLLPQDVPYFVRAAAIQHSRSESEESEKGSPDIKLWGCEAPSKQWTAMGLATTSPESAYVEERRHLPFTPTSRSSTTTRANAADLHKKLFSKAHLHLILQDRILHPRFISFLKKYKPSFLPTVASYQATLKAKAAIDYANAIAQDLPILPIHAVSVPHLAVAKEHDAMLMNQSEPALNALVNEALPAFVTHRLVTMVRECLVKEIIGSNTPVMSNLLQGLAEVYCLTDAGRSDNPVVYASAGFFEETQYGLDAVMNRNCRFLQGPRLSNPSTERLRLAVKEGREACETILNYRRDGTPFLNLLMIAPLRDNKGRVRYFIGCQVNVTDLVDKGRGLDSFQKLLAREVAERRSGDKLRKRSHNALAELGQMLSSEEMDVLKDMVSSRGNEILRHDSMRSAPNRQPRRLVGGEEVDPKSLRYDGGLPKDLHVPGVYQNYLLVRPYPSLRITFTSPTLRIPGLVQSRLMTRIGGPEQTRDQLLEAFKEGVGVTAKVNWLTSSHVSLKSGNAAGKPRWLHCTPLVGADCKVGVWMIVIVEQEQITGSLNVNKPLPKAPTVPQTRQTSSASTSSAHTRTLSERYGPAKKYAHYLRGTAEPPVGAVQAPQRDPSGIRYDSQSPRSSLEDAKVSRRGRREWFGYAA